MQPKPDDIELRARHLEQGLRKAGIKLTHQRMVICREMASATGHPDADAVYKAVREKVPTIALDTVYRTLWMLLDLRLIDTLGIPRERTRFDGNAKPHHHFVCTKCGEARDFYSAAFELLEVPEEVRAFGDVQRTQVEVRGVCLRCLETSDSERRAKGAEERS
jgi:Fur family peroxide stress response transcriptional regulator